MIEDDPAFPAMKHPGTATPEQLRVLGAGIGRLIQSYSESELRGVLYENFASWLTEIAEQLRQAAQDR